MQKGVGVRRGERQWHRNPPGKLCPKSMPLNMAHTSKLIVELS